MSKELDLKQLLEAKLGNITPVSNNADIIEHIERKIPANLMFDESATELKAKTSTHMSVNKRLTLNEFKQEFDDMNKFIENFLVKDVDYGVIPNCKKPTLLKSGAEKIMNFMQLIARTEIVNRVEDYNVGFFSYEIKVSLIDTEGIIRGEGIGIANSKESKYAKMNAFTMQNVILKMAKKRALVDGILNVANLSERFTQDIEDVNADITKDKNSTSTIPNKSITNHFEEPTKRKITDKQIKYVETLLKLHNIPNDSLKRHIEHTYNIDDLTQLSGSQASELIELIKSM